MLDTSITNWQVGSKVVVPSKTNLWEQFWYKEIKCAVSDRSTPQKWNYSHTFYVLLKERSEFKTS